MGGKLLGWRTVCAVELDPFCRDVLLARQRDGCLDPFPIWDDVRTFDGHPWRGHIDIITGGFPCQDISAAGNGAGLRGARSGLWSEFARIIAEVEPPHVLIENSPLLLSRGLVTILKDLHALGFHARWGVLSAAQAGAPHLRRRIWIAATHPDRQPLRLDKQWPTRGRLHLQDQGQAEPVRNGTSRWWSAKPNVGRTFDGLARRMDLRRSH